MRGSDVVDVAIHVDLRAPTWVVALAHPVEQALLLLAAALPLAVLSTRPVAVAVPTRLFKQVPRPVAPWQLTAPMECHMVRWLWLLLQWRILNRPVLARRLCKLPVRLLRSLLKSFANPLPVIEQ